MKNRLYVDMDFTFGIILQAILLIVLVLAIVFRKYKWGKQVSPGWDLFHASIGFFNISVILLVNWTKYPPEEYIHWKATLSTFLLLSLVILIAIKLRRYIKFRAGVEPSGNQK